MVIHSEVLLRYTLRYFDLFFERCWVEREFCFRSAIVDLITSRFFCSGVTHLFFRRFRNFE